MRPGPQHEKELSQKIIVSLIIVAFFVIMVAPILDHRFGWSPVAPAVSIVGDIVIVLSFSRFLG